MKTTDPLDAECRAGYRDGRNADSPAPNANRHPAYIHGFRCGRDDLLCGAKAQVMPSRTAAQARADWSFIVATCGGDCVQG